MKSTVLLAVGAVTVVASEPEDATSPPESSMLIVIGNPGADEYARTFDEQARRWETAAAEGGAAVTVIGRDAQEPASRDRLRDAIVAERDESQRPLWIVMIGHGTFDGREAKFNLQGTDVTAGDLATWLEGISRPLAIINGASASSPFIDRLAGPDRIVITATKSGGEENYARFGEYLSKSVGNLSADLDKDGQVSLLEAFLMASRETQAYYDGQRQLATEHALLDDNGDARGIRADYFSGLQPTVTPEGGEALDGHRAHQWHLIPSEEERRLPVKMRRRRDELELQLAELRDHKADFTEDDYYARIEPLLVEIARLYESSETAQ